MITPIIAFEDKPKPEVKVTNPYYECLTCMTTYPLWERTCYKCKMHGRKSEMVKHG